MLVRRCLLIAALAVSVTRCADQPTALKPPEGPQFATSSSSGPQSLRWASKPKFTGWAKKNGTTTTTLSLDQYVVSFWAVRGQARSVQINYSSSIDTVAHPFLTLTVVDPKYVPGVGNLGMRDSALLTVRVDTATLTVSLEPTGTIFGTPGQLQISYAGAGGDLNGDGVVDSTDANIEMQLLGLWYREGSTDPWSHLGATQSLSNKSFSYDLQHFSFYAEMLMDWSVGW